jgi:diadenosine tetraphosphate (Ap4A) HIT family hydrolase
MIEECSMCPYCKGIPKVGSKPVLNACTPFDQLLFEGSDFVLTPTLGMLVPGYLLVISKKHIYSFANFDENSLSNLETIVKKIIEKLTPLFGEYFLFEHGSSQKIQTKPYGGCINHAHLHLIPLAQKIGMAIKKELNCVQLPSLLQLGDYKENSYALLGLSDEYFITRSPYLPSQWIRRITADKMKLKKHWDWGVEFGSEELQITNDLLKKIHL